MLFPSLKNKKVGYVNLNLEAKEWMARQVTDIENQNPLLNPEICQEMITNVHEKYDLDFSYGGWMENRSFLWKDSYLEQRKTFTHLGVDFNVPSNTKVAACFDAEVIKVDDDYPEEGGWGSRVILRHLGESLYFIFAHLDRDIKCRIGDGLKEGDVFAMVGHAPYNGNWFPHLHVQTISKAYYDQLEKTNTWKELDGYGHADDISLNAKRFQDPMKFVSFRGVY